MSHFTASILWVDIQIISTNSPRSLVENKISEHSDRLPAQNFEAVLAVIVIWAGDTIFAELYKDVQKHF